MTISGLAIAHRTGSESLTVRLAHNGRLWLIALAVYVADQLSKLVVVNTIDYTDQRMVLDGFFKFVHWGNTGAAWSTFHGNNELLALIGLVALIVLLATYRSFSPHTTLGQLALGLVLGGILGNLTDRLLPGRQHVVDFLYFYLYRRGGGEVGFPAFNIADSALCIGVGLLFLVLWPRTAKALFSLEDKGSVKREA
jgi:signal peptidase II